MQCPPPRIALVVDVALHDGEHRARAVGLELRDFAEQRRNVGVTGVGQITAHLGFRMTTTRQLTDDLDDRLVVNNQRTVRLVGGNAPHLGLVRDSPLAHYRSRNEAQLAIDWRKWLSGMKQ